MNTLIVDDRPTNLRLLRALLEAEGMTVFEASDGVEALQILDREPMDAVISDVLMPRMDGFRLCLELRKRERLKDLPFIIYTATYTSPHDEKLSHDMGADFYLKKPAPAEVIMDSLRQVTQATLRRRPLEPVQLPKELTLMKEYNQGLVHKLEQKNAELHEALADRQQAYDRIGDLYNNLDRRFNERTVELQAAHRELTHSRSEVRELRGILPLCSYCKKVRDDPSYWQSVEGYISQHTDARFSHGYCPECYAKHVKPQLDALSLGQGQL